MRLASAALAFGLLLPASAIALGPGDLDRSFGIEGTVFTRLGPLVEPGQSVTAARDVETLDDGRLLVAGTAPDPSGRRAIAVARYRPDGRLDRRFGDGGSVVISLGTAESVGVAVATEPGGGAFVTGAATEPGGGEAVALVRLDSEGSVTWTATHQLGEGPSPASAGLDIVRQTDGKLAVAGRATIDAPDPEPVIARFDAATGARDATFSEDGYVIDPAPRGNPGVGCVFGAAQATALVLAPTGGIVAGGTLDRTCGASTSEPVALLRRYSSAGEPDPGFGTGSAGLAAINALAVGPDATMLAGGTTREQGMTLPGAARYTTDGAPDGPPGDEFLSPLGFGALPGQGAGAVVGLRMQQSSRIVAAIDGPEREDRVARLLADGRRDPVFGLGGLAAAEVQTPRALAVQPGGGIVVAAERIPIPGRQEQAFVLVRLFGGTAASEVAVGARARVRVGSARVKLTCSAGPGCEGIIGGPRAGQVAYELDGGDRGVFAVPVEPKARSSASLQLRVTNRPQAAVSRSVSLR